MSFIAWTEITSFHNIRKYMHAYSELLNGQSKVFYKYKVKLHGTNAAIQCHTNGTVIAQSRERVITPEEDNCGFARWVKENEDAWQLKNDLIIYGEWCGKGVQPPGVAIGEIPNKVFAVFAARPMTDNTDRLIIEPDELHEIVKNIPNTYVLPWHDQGMEINWAHEGEQLQPIVDQINAQVHQIEQCDPWVEAVFNIKGVGEGLVFYPTSNKHLGYTNLANLCFKAKGTKHQNINKSAPAQLNPQIAESVNQFVEMVLTEARLEQGATKVAGSLTFDMKLMGKFLGWISGDVEKEAQDELVASNLTWKQVKKPLSDKARIWYKTKFETL